MGVEGTKISLGFHEFLRYAIPGYAFLIVVFSLFITFGEKAFFQNLPQAVISILAGPPIGFLIHWIYYSMFSYRYIRRSKVYREIGNQIERYIQNQGKPNIKEFIEEFSKRRVLVIRCLWDNVFFSEENKMRERIEFLFTTFHSIGSVLVALWVGFFTGMYLLLSTQKIKVSTQFSLFLLTSPSFFVLCTVILISVFLFISYKLRYNLATSLEFFAVLKLRELLTKEIGLFANALSKSKGIKQQE